MVKGGSIKIRSLWGSLLLLLLVVPLQGQVQYGGVPASEQFKLEPPDSEVMVFAPDQQLQKKGEKLRATDQPGLPEHAGFSLPAQVEPATHGQWEVIDDSLHLWRVIIHSPGAIASGINFSAFELNKNARLFVYDPEKTTLLGGFDHRNNNSRRKFSTAVVPGEFIVLEYQEPYFPGKDNSPHHSLLEIESIIHLTDGGSRKEQADGKSVGSAGDCHVNINCPEGLDWQDQKRGIARMLLRVGNTYSWCSGSLVNNTAEDGTPYFLTSEHCGREADSYDRLFWQFYFNFEQQGCPGEGFPPYHMVYGADLVALGPLDGGSDFQLLLLQNPPPASWNPYWNGWDRTNNASLEGAGIHHPRGDVKKISTFNTGLVSATPTVGGKPMGTNSTWRVSWAATESGHGVTEGGSSGSPLFNDQGKIIGTLTGGSSNCDNVSGYDFYGKFWYHWNRNGISVTERLDIYLDPLETGLASLEGLDPFQEDKPPPGFLIANKETQDQARLSWYAPGYAPNPKGWYRYVSNYTHLTWAGPERATVFGAPALGLNYPLSLKKVAHAFVEHEEHQWPGNQFRFRIYDSDGMTLLYESGLLNAESLQEYIYELEEPLEFFVFFFVSVRPSHPSGYPSSLMKRENFGSGYSFFGRSGNWNPHNMNDFDGSFTHLTSIYVSQEGQKNGQVKLSRLQNLHPAVSNPIGAENQKALLKGYENSIPDGYRLYRNGEPIFTTTAEDEAFYLDQVNEGGFFRYFATALYDSMESNPSNNAYLLMTEPCPLTIEQWPYLEFFESSFDDTCWITHEFEGGGWQLKSEQSTSQGNLLPFEGNFFFGISGAQGQPNDSWLVLPEMDFSNLPAPALRFMFSTLIENPDHNGYLALMISKDDHSFEKIWDNRQHPLAEEGNTNLDWVPTTLDLKRYGGEEKIRLAFQYKGKQGGIFAVDHLEMLGSGSITHNLFVEISPDHAGSVSGKRSYLSGEEVSLTASPNISFRFDAWKRDNTFLTSDLEYRFIMPGSHKTLQAKFSPIHDPKDTLTAKVNETKVFPNPASRHLTLQFGQEMSIAVISLINIQGQIVFQNVLQEVSSGEETVISVGQLPKGVYFLKVRDQRFTEVIKIILTE